MKYLLNWVKKELNPERHISSKTTSSEYYYFYGAKIRFADHLSDRNDSELEVILVKDLTGKNKHYMIKEQNYPTMVSIPDVKTLKIVLSTFIFQFKNRYSDNIVKNTIKKDNNSLSKRDTYFNCINEYYNNDVNIDNMNNEDKDKVLYSFGSLLALDTNNKYAKCSLNQKKYIRSLLSNSIPYDNILKFVNSIFDVMFTSKMKHKTDAPQIKEIVNKFLKMYNIGIIKFPNEQDFDSTFNDNFSKEAEPQNGNITENNDVLSNDVQNETVVNYIPDTDITIKDSYNYASDEFKNIQDIHEMFEENQINILNNVIKTINESNNYTSFERKCITDIFAVHYSDIWNKLTCMQRKLCVSIITDEHMNLNETDYIINKIFDKTSFNFPVTSLCRKYIKKYSQRIKESRIAA